MNKKVCTVTIKRLTVYIEQISIPNTWKIYSQFFSTKWPGNAVHFGHWLHWSQPIRTKGSFLDPMRRNFGALWNKSAHEVKRYFYTLNLYKNSHDSFVPDTKRSTHSILVTYIVMRSTHVFRESTWSTNAFGTRDFPISAYSASRTSAQVENQFRHNLTLSISKRGGNEKLQAVSAPETVNRMKNSTSRDLSFMDSPPGTLLLVLPVEFLTNAGKIQSSWNYARVS